MIPGTPLRRQSSWQRELAEAISDPGELIHLLKLDPALIEPARAAARGFPFRVPRGYAARMRVGDPADPLLLQVLPLAAEALPAPGFGRDPVGDSAARVAPGLLQKYEGRVLLTTTGACAVHCRYCFRRHFPYAEENPAATNWRATVEHIEADSSIREVILSGGDPFTLSDTRLAALLEGLADIAHVQRIRFHTRLPIVLPARVTAELCRILISSRLPVVAVVHANHANEIDASVVDALQDLRRAGITVLNQSVLLRGVNDSVDALCALSEALFVAGVLPYYLHLLDRVEGAAHYEVAEEAAKELWRQMGSRLPGYLVPRLVREEAGASQKTVIR